jgi:UDP-N-acetylmuramoyl-tripeptide--D-alanyl-D-alanine ligase
MAELGPAGPQFHSDIGAYAADKGVQVLVAVGALGDGYVEGYAGVGDAHLVADASEAAALVRDLIEPGDVVLLKGSRSVGLERVASTLTDRTGQVRR